MQIWVCLLEYFHKSVSDFWISENKNILAESMFIYKCRISVYPEDTLLSCVSYQIPKTQVRVHWMRERLLKSIFKYSISQKIYSNLPCRWPATSKPNSRKTIPAQLAESNSTRRPATLACRYAITPPGWVSNLSNWELGNWVPQPPTRDHKKIVNKSFYGTDTGVSVAMT